MKTFTCHICGKYIGEMTRGIFSRSAICLCRVCGPRLLELRENVEDCGKDVPEFLSVLFGGKSQE